MRLSKVRDGFGDISKDGVALHNSVRFLVDTEGERLAVFPNTKQPPSVVYALDEVTYTMLRKPCSCKGDAPKMSVYRLWDAADRQAANA